VNFCKFIVSRGFWLNECLLLLFMNVVQLIREEKPLNFYMQCIQSGWLNYCLLLLFMNVVQLIREEKSVNFYVCSVSRVVG
jgi:hypothetical protein